MLTTSIGPLPEIFADLVHDLCQPLSTIEQSVCYLKRLLSPAEEPVAAQLTLITRQVDQAARILADASVRMAQCRSQCAATEASLDVTNSQTAGVT